MRSRVAISYDEVRAVVEKLQRAAEQGPEGFSAKDYREATGLSHASVALHLARFIASGLVRFVGKRADVDVAGRRTLVPVYRLMERPKRG